MADKRFVLINRLRDQTVNGKVTWERTASKGVFQASFPSYSIKLAQVPSDEPDASVYILRIYDGEGALIEDFNDEDLPRELTPNNPYEIMGQLYDAARRQAMGVEAALDSILTELEDGPPDDAAPEDGPPPEEDIPF